MQSSQELLTTMPLQINQLPAELLARIFDLSVPDVPDMSEGAHALVCTKARSKLSQVCKTWCQVVNTSWTSFSLGAISWEQWEAQQGWLKTVVKQSSSGVHEIFIDDLPGNNTDSLYASLIACITLWNSQ